MFRLATGHMFVHIPKCGGSKVRHELHGLGQPLGRQHDRPRHNRIGFSFVRHPVTWLESFYRSRAGWGEVDNYSPLSVHQGASPVRELMACGASTFDGFVRNYLKRQPGYVTRLYERMLGSRGDSCVSMVGHTEWLEDDLQTILDRLGVQHQVGQERVNVSAGDRVHWDEYLRNEVVKVERPAIDRWYGGETDPRRLERLPILEAEPWPES